MTHDNGKVEAQSSVSVEKRTSIADIHEDASGRKVTRLVSPEEQVEAESKARQEELKNRKLHLAELERRVKRDDYSPEKKALYREALARAKREVKELEKSDGND